MKGKNTVGGKTARNSPKIVILILLFVLNQTIVASPLKVQFGFVGTYLINSSDISMAASYPIYIMKSDAS